MRVRQLLCSTSLTAAVVASALAAVMLALRDTPAAIGAVFGCALGLASLASLERQVSRLISPHLGRRPVFRFILVGFLKYAALGAAIWAFLRKPGASGAGLVAGLTVVYVCLAACALRQGDALSAAEET